MDEALAALPWLGRSSFVGVGDDAGVSGVPGKYRSYLRILIELQTSPERRGNVDPSDIVQH